MSNPISILSVKSAQLSKKNYPKRNKQIIIFQTNKSKNWFFFSLWNHPFISKLPYNNSSECLQAHTPPLAQTICPKTIAKSKTKPNLNEKKKLRRIDSHWIPVDLEEGVAANRLVATPFSF